MPTGPSYKYCQDQAKPRSASPQAVRIQAPRQQYAEERGENIITDVCLFAVADVASWIMMPIFPGQGKILYGVWLRLACKADNRSTRQSGEGGISNLLCPNSKGQDKVLFFLGFGDRCESCCSNQYGDGEGSIDSLRTREFETACVRVWSCKYWIPVLWVGDIVTMYCPFVSRPLIMTVVLICSVTDVRCGRMWCRRSHEGHKGGWETGLGWLVDGFRWHLTPSSVPNARVCCWERRHAADRVVPSAVIFETTGKIFTTCKEFWTS